MKENAKLTLGVENLLAADSFVFPYAISAKPLPTYSFIQQRKKTIPVCRPFASIPDDGAMELIDRSYLHKASARSSGRNTAGGDTVKDLVYPYGNAQTITLSGSTKLMVWLDDDQSRNLTNKTALYYSVLSNGEWR